MKIILLIIAISLAGPSIVESWADRKGESVIGKRWDSLILLVFAVLSSTLLWLLLDVQPLKTVCLLLGWRLLIFDPLVNWFLKRHSESHKDINIWTYVGNTSRIDRLVSKVNPWVRFSIRVALFIASFWWFLV